MRGPMSFQRHAALLLVVALAACGTESMVDVPDPTEGTVTFTVLSQGEARDTAFSLAIPGVTSLDVTAGDEASVNLLEGSYDVELAGVAENCRVLGDNPQTFDVVAGNQSNVYFDVACTTNGELKITIETTGEDIDLLYSLVFNTTYRTVLSGPNQFHVVSLPVGPYSVLLDGVADNCQVETPNPVEVDVTTLARGEIGFSVACTAL